MKKALKCCAVAMAWVGLTGGMAMATPSTQIWIPSTDVKEVGTFHLDIDNYIRTSADDAGDRPHIYNLGLGTGVLPFELVQMEVGVDYLVSGGAADSNPIYFNAKIGTPEDILFQGSPALAVGGYGFGTKKDVTDANIVYGLVAKTLPVIGRLSAGYYIGNGDVLVDAEGRKDRDGVLLSWDRDLSEISDKLWAAVDYQGGDNEFGALSFGVSWSFAENVSVILGYNIFNEKQTGGENTFTTQLDITF